MLFNASSAVSLINISILQKKLVEEILLIIFSMCLHLKYVTQICMCIYIFSGYLVHTFWKFQGGDVQELAQVCDIRNGGLPKVSLQNKF